MVLGPGLRRGLIAVFQRGQLLDNDSYPNISIPADPIPSPNARILFYEHEHCVEALLASGWDSLSRSEASCDA